MKYFAYGKYSLNARSGLCEYLIEHEISIISKNHKNNSPEVLWLVEIKKGSTRLQMKGFLGRYEFYLE